MGPARVAVLLLVLAATVWIGVGLTTEAGSDDEPIDDALIRPVDNGSAIWPYTSRSRSVSGRTLALNLVVVGDPGAVRFLLTNRTGVDWEPAENDTRARLDAAGIDWRAARGAARYTYLRPPDGEGRWVLADHQLATGHYLGSRVHIRAYSSPDREWTALQAHQEYWDWFRLRHTVTGVASAGQFVETDLREHPSVARVARLRSAGGAGSPDRWLTILEVAVGAVLVGVVGRWRRDWAVRAARRGLPMVAALAAIVVGVRLTGLLLETVFPAAAPKLFAAALYPVLVAGPVVAVRRLAPRYRSTVAFGLTVAGLGVGIAADFLLLGILAVPTRLVLHRTLLLVALGAVAVGVAATGRRGRATMAVGIVAWVSALAAPLVGVV